MIVLILQIRRASEAGNSLSLFRVSSHVNQARRRIHEGFTMLRKTLRSFAPHANLRFGRSREFVPPPTKCTISNRSPSCSGVSGHRARATISRLSSTATRSPCIPRCSMNCSSVVSSAQSFGSPFTNKCIPAMYRIQDLEQIGECPRIPKRHVNLCHRETDAATPRQSDRHCLTHELCGAVCGDLVRHGALWELRCG